MSQKGQQLYRRASQVIPGGTQLLSKRPEMILPDQWPAYYARARGVETWALDGTKYIDMSTSGIGACVLGFADPDVDSAVHSAIDSGSMASLNCPEEVELAELLCELHPWADMVRYARGGGEAMAVGVRIARACTGRDKIAFCGYHGWHDWYVAANLAEAHALDSHLLSGIEPNGVPRGLMGTALPFHYNNLQELESLVESHGDLAAIVMEPLRSQQPQPGFLEGIRKIATQIGAVLIFDEVTSGWRMNTGGVHLLHPVVPDVAVFAKAISNGYPMAAIIGIKGIMEAAKSSFISSTSWTEKIGPVAALATIRKHKSCSVAERIIKVGEQVQSGWLESAHRAGLAVEVTGIPPLSHLSFNYENRDAIRSLFTQSMLYRGFLATDSFYATYAHLEEHINSYLVAVEETFQSLARAVENGMVERQLRGPVAQYGFQRLT